MFTAKSLPIEHPNTKPSPDHLKSVGIFADIKEVPAALDALALIMHLKVFNKGHDIIKEGTEGTEMYILISGTAAIFKQTPGGDEYKVFILHGDKHPAFGETGLLEAEKRSATIRCDTQCQCLLLGRADFEKFSKDHPEWALPVYRKIAHNVVGRLRKTNDDLLLLYNALVAEIRGR